MIPVIELHLISQHAHPPERLNLLEMASID
jgi:hypothetical protein